LQEYKSHSQVKTQLLRGEISNPHLHPVE